MKLITELNEEVKYVVEEVDGKKKNYFIEGVFMQGDIKNRNGRMYPKEVLAKEAARYNKEYIQKNKAYGELGHPQGPTINLERVSHMIKSLVKSLIDEGAQLVVSSRGMGTLKEKQGGAQEVQSDFMLSTAADIVADPSAPEAFVNGVMEGVEWVYDAASSSYSAMQVVDEIKKVGIKDAKKLEEHKIDLFNKFMRNL